MGKFQFEKCGYFEGLYLIQPGVFGDARGYFMETYNYNDFKEAGLDMVFVQDNQSRSTKGVLRGLHFQKEHTQGKLVRVISGEVFDVVVDIRKGSKTFGKWFGVTLSVFTYSLKLLNFSINVRIFMTLPQKRASHGMMKISASTGRFRKALRQSSPKRIRSTQPFPKTLLWRVYYE